MTFNKRNINSLFYTFIITHLIVWTLIPTITNNCTNYSNNNLHSDFYCLDNDDNGNCIVQAEACYDIKVAQTGLSNARRAELTTEIRWEDAYNNKDTLYFCVTQIIY